MEIIFCEDYSKHPPHEWTGLRNTKYKCRGKSTHERPGDEQQPAKQYYCIRLECRRAIKIIAFNEPHSYCSVNCEKLDKGEEVQLSESATPG